MTTAALAAAILSLAPHVDHVLAISIANNAAAYSVAYDVPPEIIVAVAFRESTFRPDIFHGKRTGKPKCIGLMGIAVGGEADDGGNLFATHDAIRMAAKYLRHLKTKHRCGWGGTLSLYNGHKFCRPSRYSRDVLATARAVLARQ